MDVLAGGAKVCRYRVQKSNPRSLAGASACMADDGQSVIVFGGLEVDKNPNAFGGDTLYSDEIYWFSTQLDEEEGQIKL